MQEIIHEKAFGAFGIRTSGRRRRWMEDKSTDLWSSINRDIALVNNMTSASK